MVTFASIASRLNDLWLRRLEHRSKIRDDVLIRMLRAEGFHRDAAEWVVEHGRDATTPYVAWLRDHVDYRTGDIVLRCRSTRCESLVKIPVWLIPTKDRADRIDFTRVFTCTLHRDQPVAEYRATKRLARMC